MAIDYDSYRKRWEYNRNFQRYDLRGRKWQDDERDLWFDEKVSKEDLTGISRAYARRQIFGEDEPEPKKPSILPSLIEKVMGIKDRFGERRDIDISPKGEVTVQPSRREQFLEKRRKLMATDFPPGAPEEPPSFEVKPSITTPTIPPRPSFKLTTRAGDAWKRTVRDVVRIGKKGTQGYAAGLAFVKATSALDWSEEDIQKGIDAAMGSLKAGKTIGDFYKEQIPDPTSRSFAENFMVLMAREAPYFSPGETLDWFTNTWSAPTMAAFQLSLEGAGGLVRSMAKSKVPKIRAMGKTLSKEVDLPDFLTPKEWREDNVFWRKWQQGLYGELRRKGISPQQANVHSETITKIARYDRKQFVSMISGKPQAPASDSKLLDAITKIYDKIGIRGRGPKGITPSEKVRGKIPGREDYLSRYERLAGERELNNIMETVLKGKYKPVRPGDPFDIVRDQKFQLDNAAKLAVKNVRNLRKLYALKQWTGLTEATTEGINRAIMLLEKDLSLNMQGLGKDRMEVENSVPSSRSAPRAIFSDRDAKELNPATSIRPSEPFRGIDDLIIGEKPTVVEPESVISLPEGLPRVIIPGAEPPDIAARRAAIIEKRGEPGRLKQVIAEMEKQAPYTDTVMLDRLRKRLEAITPREEAVKPKVEEVPEEPSLSEQAKKAAPTIKEKAEVSVTEKKRDLSIAKKVRKPVRYVRDQTEAEQTKLRAMDKYINESTIEGTTERRFANAVARYNVRGQKGIAPSPPATVSEDRAFLIASSITKIFTGKAEWEPKVTRKIKVGEVRVPVEKPVKPVKELSAQESAQLEELAKNRKIRAFADSLANKYKKFGVEKEDLIAKGLREGLIKAIRTYDPERKGKDGRKVKLETWAWKQMRNTMIDFSKKKAIKERLKEVPLEVSVLGVEGEVMRKEVEVMGATPEEIIIQKKRQKEAKEMFDKAMAFLSPRERAAIGMELDKAPVAKIAKALNLSRQRVYNLLKDAHKKMDQADPDAIYRQREVVEQRKDKLEKQSEKVKEAEKKATGFEKEVFAVLNDAISEEVVEIAEALKEPETPETFTSEVALYALGLNTVKASDFLPSKPGEIKIAISEDGDLVRFIKQNTNGTIEIMNGVKMILPPDADIGIFGEINSKAAFKKLENENKQYFLRPHEAGFFGFRKRKVIKSDAAKRVEDAKEMQRMANDAFLTKTDARSDLQRQIVVGLNGVVEDEVKGVLKENHNNGMDTKTVEVVKATIQETSRFLDRFPRASIEPLMNMWNKIMDKVFLFHRLSNIKDYGKEAKLRAMLAYHNRQAAAEIAVRNATKELSALTPLEKEIEGESRVDIAFKITADYEEGIKIWDGVDAATEHFNTFSDFMENLTQMYLDNKIISRQFKDRIIEDILIPERNKFVKDSEEWNIKEAVIKKLEKMKWVPHSRIASQTLIEKLQKEKGSIRSQLIKDIMDKHTAGRQRLERIGEVSAKFKKRKSIYTLKDYAKMLNPDDGTPWINKEDFDFRRVMMVSLTDYYQRLALQRFFNFLGSVDLVRARSKETDELGWENPQIVGIATPELTNKVAHPMVIYALNEMRELKLHYSGISNLPIIGWLYTLFRDVQIFQKFMFWIKPQIIFSYDILQAFTRGILVNPYTVAHPLRITALLARSISDVFNKSDDYIKVLDAGLMQAPAEIAFGSIRQIIDVGVNTLNKEKKVVRMLEYILGISIKDSFWKLPEESRKKHISKIVFNSLKLPMFMLKEITWGGDKILRMFSYHILRDLMDWKFQEAVDYAANAHGAYSAPSVIWKKGMSHIFLVHTFRLMMPIEFAKSIFEFPFNSMRFMLELGGVRTGKKITGPGGDLPPNLGEPKKGTEREPWKWNWNKASVQMSALFWTVILPATIDYYLKKKGFKPVGPHFGIPYTDIDIQYWRYEKEVYDPKTERSYVMRINVNPLVNMLIKTYTRMFGYNPYEKIKDRSWFLSLPNRMRIELAPIWRMAGDWGRNRKSFGRYVGEKIYEVEDPEGIKAAKVSMFFIESTYKAFFARHALGEKMNTEQYQTLDRVMKDQFDNWNYYFMNGFELKGVKIDNPLFFSYLRPSYSEQEGRYLAVLKNELRSEKRELVNKKEQEGWSDKEFDREWAKKIEWHDKTAKRIRKYTKTGR